MDIVKPIFIVGTGRGGTTIFYRTLIQHNSITSFTNWDAGYPRLFKYGIMPFIEKKKFTRNFFKKFKKFEPSKEMKGILEYSKIYQKGIPLSKEDLKPIEAKRLKLMIKKCLKYHKGERFIAKNTSNGLRIEYLNEIFPDAIFIHVLRDGRANTNSYMEVDWFPGLHFWWNEHKKCSDLIEEGEPLERLAALHWKNNTEELIRQSKTIPKDRFYRVKYEDFTEKPEQFFREICEFCELEWSEEFIDVIRNSNLRNTNYKWKENLSKEQAETILLAIKENLIEYGYI